VDDRDARHDGGPEQARALARLGDKDGAFERLTRFLETGNPALPLLTDEPDFVTLRDDPRWTVDYDLVYKRKK